MFATAIKKYRVEHGLQQVQVALKAHLDPGHLCRLEQGQRGATQQMAAALVNAYNSTEIADAYCSQCPVCKAKQHINQTNVVYVDFGQRPKPPGGTAKRVA